jgi:hypothetical protein
MTISASLKKSTPDSFRKEFTPLPILLFQKNEGMSERTISSPAHRIPRGLKQPTSALTRCGPVF